MRKKELETRLAAMEGLLDKLDRSVDRIELVTVVREPSTGMSADAYTGLRKQVIAAVGERNAHLHQLAQFDASLRAGATPEDLRVLVAEWLGQSSLGVLEDPAAEAAFDFVGPDDGEHVRVVRPAYVDRVTGRVVRSGVAERVKGVLPAARVRDAEPEQPEAPRDVAQPIEQAVPADDTTGGKA